LFIGAALGNAFAMMTGQPVQVFAGIGMVAVFAAASNTPLACTLMGVELFGFYGTAFFALGCLIAYVVSGREGIYQDQK
jgi:H+/Cl- antiporter ClcA